MEKSCRVYAPKPVSGPVLILINSPQRCKEQSFES